MFDKFQFKALKKNLNFTNYFKKNIHFEFIICIYSNQGINCHQKSPEVTISHSRVIFCVRPKK